MKPFPIFRKMIAASVLAASTVFVTAQAAAEKQTLEDYKGDYTGSWRLLAQGSGGSTATTPGLATFKVSASSKGRVGAVTIAMGAGAVGGSTVGPGAQKFSFSGKRVAIQEVLPAISPGYPLNGNVIAKPASIRGVADANFSGSIVHSTYVMTTHSTKKVRKIKIVFVSRITNGTSTVSYTYTFQGKGKLKK